MGLTKFLTSTFLLHQIFGTEVCTSDICKKPITKKLINGYYCPTVRTTVQLFRVPHHICTHHCISVMQCSVLSYYVDKRLCLMHKEVCLEMTKDKEHVLSSIILYEPTKHECISWLPYQGSVPEGERFVRMQGGFPLILVRLHRNNEILPGRFLQGNGEVRTISLVNGPVFIKEVANSAMEFFVVSDICSVTWVPYVTGSPMPLRALVGGRKANSKPLFIASLWTTGADMYKKYFYGHYDPESGLGYTYHGDVRSNSSVDIMVENWQWHHAWKAETHAIWKVSIYWPNQSCWNDVDFEPNNYSLADIALSEGLKHVCKNWSICIPFIIINLFMKNLTHITCSATIMCITCKW